MLGFILFCALSVVFLAIAIKILCKECKYSNYVGEWIGGMLLVVMTYSIFVFLIGITLSATTGFIPVEEGHADVYVGSVEYGGIWWKDYQADVFCGEVKNNSKFTVTTHRHDLGKELFGYAGKKVRITYRKWLGVCPVWLGSTDKELMKIEVLEDEKDK
jgi:hypothetical protein